MQNNSKKDIRNQHIVNYKNTIIEVIKNNTNSLVDDDIMSLIRKPPLDSMDLIQSKFLSMAKKNKIVLNSEELNEKIDKYRKDILKLSKELKEIRINELSDKVDAVKLKDNEIIKINKKDFNAINRIIKKTIKEQVIKSLEEEILAKIEQIFPKNVDSNLKEKIIKDMTKYLKKNYLNQLLENIDIKILVKDTTLINSTKELAERYIFSLNNSRLLNDFE